MPSDNNTQAHAAERPQPLRTAKMLTVAQKAKPFGKGTANGPFKNVSIQVGVIERQPSDPVNFFWLKPRVDARVGLPFYTPRGVQIPEAGTIVKVVGSVTGIKDMSGRHHAGIVARSFERPNVLDLTTRNVVHMYPEKLVGETIMDGDKPKVIKTQDEANNQAARKSNGSENTVELAGIVVGHERRPGILDPEKGAYTKFPSLTLFLRQDSNPDIVIPVRYTTNTEGKIDQALRRTPWGALVHVRGEHRVFRDPVLKLDEEGKPIPAKNEDGSIKREGGQTIYEPLLDDEGKPVLNYYSEIIIKVPEAPNKNDIAFLENDVEPPAWITKMVEERQEAQRRKEAEAVRHRKEAKLEAPTGSVPDVPIEPVRTQGLGTDEFSQLMALRNAGNPENPEAS